MSIASSFAQQAPELPSYKGAYRAIYLEPIDASGERFTIGIMASAEKENKVIQTLSNKVLECMYGERAAQITQLVGIAINHADAYLKRGGDINDWVPPFSAISAGKIQNTRSNAKMQGILFQAITSYASLYSGDLIEEGINEFSEQIEEIQVLENRPKLLITEVKQIVLSRNKLLRQNWNKRVTTSKGSDIHIDYLGAHYNANFSNAHIKSKVEAIKSAKAKLYDLEILRDNRKSEIFNQQFELIVQLGRKPSSDEVDRFKEIEILADEQQLRVVKATSAEEIAKRILQQDAA